MTFNKLFEGNLDAYLTYDDPKDAGDVVKVKPDYLTVKRVDDKRTIKPDAWAEIIDEAIAKHLAGRKSFGVAPQRDGKVRWGALDIDHYPYLLTDDDVFAFIRAWVDPCLVSRSKSGGVHVYAFTEDWVEEDHMRRYLCAKRDALLKGDILKKAQEVFPKEVDGDDKMPPRINLPGYHGRVVLGWSKPGLIELCWSTDESKRRDPDWAAIYDACKVPHARFLETILADLTAGPPDRRKSERKKTKWAGGYRKPTEGPAMAGRNAYLYSCGASARARGADDAEVEAVMREVLEECENPEHVLYKAASDDPFTEAEFQRCLKQVLALEQGETKISFSKVETINEEWGLMNTHGKAEFLNMLTLEVSDKQSFLLFNAHRAAEVDAWLQDPDKRQYSGYVLEDPRTYEGTGFNMFTGWVHTPTTGDVRLYEMYLKEIAAQGDEALAHWITTFVADGVQRPWSLRPGTALAMRGPSGSGKSFLGASLSCVLGGERVHEVHKSDDMTAEHNIEFFGKTFLLGEEAIFAGSPRQANILKNLCTAPRWAYHAKYRNRFMGKNVHRLVATTNDTQAVHIDNDDRRWTVAEVNRVCPFDPNSIEGRRWWKPYYELIENQPGDVLRYLLEYKVDRELIGFPHATAAKASDKIASDPILELMHDIMAQGYIPDDTRALARISTATLMREVVKRGGSRQTPSRTWANELRTRFGLQSCRSCTRIEKEEFRAMGATGEPELYLHQRHDHPGVQLLPITEMRAKVAAITGEVYPNHGKWKAYEAKMPTNVAPRAEDQNSDENVRATDEYLAEIGRG